MKRRKKAAHEQSIEFPVWTREQAQRALPYIASLMRSVREHYIQMQAYKRQENALANRPGRPDRATIIGQEDARKHADRAEQELSDAVDELMQLNIHCTDPVNGVAMIPFVQADQLAWFVFDLFQDNKMGSWRFHHDALAMRRPLEEVSLDKPSATFLT